MIYCHPYFEKALTVGDGEIYSVVIENPAAYAEILRDISSSIDGNNEKSVLMDQRGEKILTMSTSAELLSSFYPFDLNKKTLLSRITSALEKETQTPEQYQQTAELLAKTEAYLFTLAESFDCRLAFPKLSPASVIKSSGVEIVDDYSSLPEKLLDYFELVREFEREKMFFTINLRAFLTEKEAEEFCQSVAMHGFSVIMFENREYQKTKWEKRLILDNDLCIIE